MLLIGAVLSLVMGVILGLLGGGGSILTLPILVFALGMESKEAIATSLLIVGLTSAVGTLQHAYFGRVQWRTGLIFGLFAMLGAYGGGRLAVFFSGSTLIALFALLMGITGLAMLRPKKEEIEAKPFSLFPVMAEGVVVGGVTGLVGAGGGFLVVPALVMFGGMPMRKAIGTSLFVITLKSFAGLLGHAQHVHFDIQLALTLALAAIIGSFVGTSLTSYFKPAELRKTFALFVLIMAPLIGFSELSEPIKQALFVDRWSFWAGGTALAAVVLSFLLIEKRRLGVSTGFEDLLKAFTPASSKSWRLPFMGGIILGGLIAATLSGSLGIHTEIALIDGLLGTSIPAKGALFITGGVLLGYGARTAGGCTSGHGMVGVAQLAPSSLISTAAFMVSGFVVTQLLFQSFPG